MPQAFSVERKEINQMSPAQFEAKINLVKNAWTSLAPNDSFGGMTLAEFNTLINPSFTARTAGLAIQNQLSGNIADRTAADAVTAAAIKRVVFSVLGSPEYGESSPLYRAMGYKTPEDKASGLSRTATATSPTPSTGV
jgi:hypothetical protein